MQPNFIIFYIIFIPHSFLLLFFYFRFDHCRAWMACHVLLPTFLLSQVLLATALMSKKIGRRESERDRGIEG